jgi:uncharacterized membrane protein (DUF4010 family)
MEAAEAPWLEFALALAIGALVGIEREQKKRAGEIGSGLRTFILVALAGATAAWLSGSSSTPWIFLGTAAFVATFVALGYWAEAKAHPEQRGKTTEIGVIVVYLLGGAVVLGDKRIAVALAIATSAILAFKEPLHGIVDRIGREELQAAIKLLIATFIVLPLLPDRAIDPLGAINPYKLWWLVILISGLSFAGYVATRWLGSGGGLVVTGLGGGLVSSTAATLSLARRSKEVRDGAATAALAGTILLAWTVMPARIAILVAVVGRPLLGPLGVPLAALGVSSAAFAFAYLRRGTRDSKVAGDLRFQNPFRLTASIRFALVFAAVLFAVAFVRERLPGIGLQAVAALAGLTDVDAITLSMARSPDTEGGTGPAASAVVVAALSNTLAKGALAVSLGSPGLRKRIAIATGATFVAGVAALAWQLVG